MIEGKRKEFFEWKSIDLTAFLEIFLYLENNDSVEHATCVKCFVDCAIYLLLR